VTGKTLRQIMTTDVRTLSRGASVYEAARLMKELNVGIIPIVEGENLFGVITDRDIVLRVVAEGRDSMTVQVEEIVSQDVTMASPDWEVDRAAQVMAQQQIRRLPVVENNRLVGIVSLGDLAVEGTKEKVAGQTLSQISEPAQPKS